RTSIASITMTARRRAGTGRASAAAFTTTGTLVNSSLSESDADGDFRGRDDRGIDMPLAVVRSPRFEQTRKLVGGQSVALGQQAIEAGDATRQRCPNTAANSGREGQRHGPVWPEANNAERVHVAPAERVPAQEGAERESRLIQPQVEPRRREEPPADRCERRRGDDEHPAGRVAVERKPDATDRDDRGEE